MICPGCNKNVEDGKEFCDNCGTALFGPKSILLNEPELNTSMNKNNISSITGIDIKSISNNASVYTPLTSNVNNHETGASNEKKVKKFDIKNIILVIMSLVLIALVAYIFFRKDTKECEVCKEPVCKPCPTVDNKVPNTNGYKVSTSKYTFEIPTGAIYSEDEDFIHIRTNSLTMRVNPVTNGNVDRITAASYKSMYKDYAETKVIEDVINNKKLIMVTFNTGGAFYLHFYYQLDGGKLLYGEASSLVEKDITSQNVRKMIGSFVPKENSQVITYEPVGFDFNAVLSMLR